jgi:hypothetical protein
MFSIINRNLTLSAARKLIDNNNNQDTLSTAKRIISLISGAYIFQRGIRNIYTHPLISAQEIALGGFLVFDAITGIANTYPKKPTDPSQIRKNQIQGNDPSTTPAFV